MIRPLLLIVAASVFAIGLVMIFSTTSAEVLDHDLDQGTHQALFRQIAYALAGMAAGIALWKTGYASILKYSPALLLFFSILLAAVLIPGIGKEVNGSKRWLMIAGFSFQPSEFVKYLIPAYFIHQFLDADKSTLTFKAFIKVIGLIAIPISLILVEPNNGTAGVTAVTVVVLCLLMQIPFKFWAWPLLVFICISGTFALQLPYVSARLKVYLNPELDLRGKGHQPYQAKIAVGSGQLFGKGPGNSLQKLSYLPEAQNDYIAAIYGEEFGFIGILLLVTLYMLIAFFGFYLSCQSGEKSGCYLGGAITFIFCFQAFLNLGVVSGLLPSTGLNLPLFSQGGSSLIANIIGLSLLLSI
jgi:cell division protein FtsW